MLEWFDKVVLGFVRQWWMVILIVESPLLGAALLAALYRAVQDFLDRAYPDNMPAHTGQWLKDQLRVRGLENELQVCVVEGDHGESVDAFYPRSAAIGLERRTYEKADPSFWALGAHELAHAINYRRAGWIGSLFESARGLHQLVWMMAVNLLFANFWFGATELNALVYVMMLVAIGCSLVILADELSATVLAMLILRQDPAIEQSHLVGCGFALGTALLTYLWRLAAMVMIVRQWGWVSTRVRLGALEMGSGSEHTLSWAAVVAAVLSLALAWRALQIGLELYLLRRGPDPASEELVPWRTSLLSRALAEDLWWNLPLLFFLMLVWDAPLGPVFVGCAALAMGGLVRVARGLFFALCKLPIRWLDGFFGTLHKDHVEPDHGQSQRFVRDELTQLNPVLHTLNDPPWYLWADWILRARFAPLLVVWWGASLLGVGG